jgi:hypothetical protein
MLPQSRASPAASGLLSSKRCCARLTGYLITALRFIFDEIRRAVTASEPAWQSPEGQTLAR